MRAMVLDAAEETAAIARCSNPRPDAGQLLVRVSACAVCRTDLHIVDGELPKPKLPLIPGHEIVGRVEEIGRARENNFARAIESEFRGWAGPVVNANSAVPIAKIFAGVRVSPVIPSMAVTPNSPSPTPAFVFIIPKQFDNVAAAPLLCAGLIGFRALRKCGDPKRLGLYGFGAAAHIIAQVARFEGREVFAFTRAGRYRDPKVCATSRRYLGWRIGRSAARKIGCRHHLRTCRRADAGRIASSR